ncbi:Dolichyl-phosphate-mannose-protein mannosyltransferase [Chitinophaga jiangningensis]|uniref:Dolichyl-phosphate-mannose-protein mannosyltransferase n=1 Tax=Chitinophaga jiangningensis TaxID=1419482 RepID=A0A1M7K9F0_9BACT|nr:glycosyltransferase family 39 protein [Chitinophaga jiangningensis]SHM61868.1 Dolichyl-phosphate-mannose-protein mannosyltransferase [Chitinophaga jiangningensis]
MKKRTLILAGFIILKFLIQYLVISPAYDLQRDEYLHLDQAHHPAWGYLSVPPVTSWISYIILLMGNSVFWIKFFPALFGAITIWIIWKAIETLGGDLFALVTGATCITFSVLLGLNTLYQPNSLDVLCWAAFYYCVIKYIKTEQPRWLYFGAVVFAAGFLNKYNMVFLLLGIAPAMLISPQRKIFTQKHFYVALALGLILISPNLLWQYQNSFPVVHHMKELAERQLVHVDRVGFLKSQVLYFIGSSVAILAGLFALLFYKPFRPYRLFFGSFFFTIFIFLYFRAKDYYAIGLYPIYISFGAVYLSHILATGWQRYLRPVLIIIPLLFFIPMYQVAFPNNSPEYIMQHQERYQRLGRLRWEDGRDHDIPQDYADMLGWKELAHKVDSIYTGVAASGKTLVLCDNYGQAGAINYYTKQGIKAVSFNADYVNWFDLSVPYTNLIRVKDYQEQYEELQESAPFFQTGVAADSITNRFAREHGATIFVFTGAKVDIRERLRSEIEEEKNYE